MDFSNCNLISFGDSFTFGQGTEGNGISYMQYLELYEDKLTREQITRNWVNKSNQYSYTTKLSYLLGCKKYVNLGQMGASNDHTVYYLREFLRNNHNKNNMYIVALTEPSRHATLQYRELIKQHTERTNSYLFLESIRSDYLEGRWKDNKNTFKSNFYKKLDNRFWGNYIGYFKTQEDTLFNHIQNYYTICELLKGKNYIMFDVLNGLDYQISKQRFPNFNTEHGIISDIKDDNLIKNDFQPILNSNNFIQNYVEHVKNNNNYYNFYKLNEQFSHYCKLKQKEIVYRNVNDMIFQQGYRTKFDHHWSRQGHDKVAKVLRDFITERS